MPLVLLFSDDDIISFLTIPPGRFKEAKFFLTSRLSDILPTIEDSAMPCVDAHVGQLPPVWMVSQFAHRFASSRCKWMTSGYSLALFICVSLVTPRLITPSLTQRDNVSAFDRVIFENPNPCFPFVKYIFSNDRPAATFVFAF